MKNLRLSGSLLWAFLSLSLRIASAHECAQLKPDFIKSIHSNTIVVGESHGTQEMPKFAGELACHFVKSGETVLLGLEMPSSLQTAINAYHASEGSIEQKRELLRHPFWMYTADYGMASQAIFELLELSRKLKMQGFDIKPFAYDESLKDRAEKLSPNEKSDFVRDFQMAHNIALRSAQYENARLIILSGNNHVRKNQSSSMVFYLSKMQSIFSIGFSDLGGTAWQCTGKTRELVSCGSQHVKASVGDAEEYDAVVQLGLLHASPPAKTLHSRAE